MRRLLPPFGVIPKAPPAADSKFLRKIEHLGKISHAPYLTTLAACIAVELNDLRATKVAAIETMGIPLGVALAIHLGVGVVVLRKGPDLCSSLEFTSEPYGKASEAGNGSEKMLCLY